MKSNNEDAARRRAARRFLAAAPSTRIVPVRQIATRNPFTLGVASGAVLPTSCVLWTRLAPEPLDGGGLGASDALVSWEIATDERFRRIARRGTVRARASRGHSVHVEVGGLQPAREYWYRFRAGDSESPVGRTKTAPARNAAPRALRLAFASCQQYEQGYFNAYRHMADESLDLVVHLGDYIYESSWGSDFVRRHASPEPRTLVEYRNRHAQYRTDPDLQRMHQLAPWFVVWDDHEVENDYARDQSEDLDPKFLERRAAAYQAYFEHMPLKLTQAPRSGGMQLYDRYDFGDLVRVHLLDNRQYRSYQACPRPGRGGANWVAADCRELFDTSRTYLGTTQERWLEQGLRSARTRWNLIAQQTLMARYDPRRESAPLYWTDGWDGYPAARQRLLDVLARERIRNAITIGGDVHSFFVADLKSDFANPASSVVATEFVTTSITSQARPVRQLGDVFDANPHIRLIDPRNRGYVVLDLQRNRATATLRAVSTVKSRSSRVFTRARYEVDPQTPGARLQR
jgi:alkaline phosphatase D